MAASSTHPRLIHRHAEDAAFYWARFMDGSLASNHDLRSMTRFEHLLHANLEGLRVAQHESSRRDGQGELTTQGDAGWQATWKRTRQWRTADEGFVAAVLAFEASPTSNRNLSELEDLACDQFDQAPHAGAPALAHSLASAAAWLPWSACQGTITRWAASAEPVLRHCALATLAFHRVPAASALSAWMQDPHPLVRARALRAAGELGQGHAVDGLLHALEPPADKSDSMSRGWAGWSL